MMCRETKVNPKNTAFPRNQVTRQSDSRGIPNRHTSGSDIGRSRRLHRWNFGQCRFLTGVSKVRYSRETRSWEVIPEREPTAAGAEVTADLLEQRKQFERQNWAFVTRLRQAVLAGLETPAGVLGHKHGPRKSRRSAR